MMAMNLRSPIIFSILFTLCLGLQAQVSVGPLNYNPAYQSQKEGLQKIVEHPSCQNKPFLFVYPADITRPDCNAANGQITINIDSSEPNISISLNGAAPSSVSQSSVTFDNLDSGVYFIESNVELEPGFVLESDIRVLLNNDGIEDALFAEIIAFEPAFCGLGTVRKADALLPGVKPVWTIFSRDGSEVGVLDLFVEELPLEPGDYFTELMDFDDCPILVDFTLPETISFELTETNMFFDDFSDSDIFPNDSLWADDQAFINTTFAFDPPSLGVATLDGLDENGEPYIPSPNLAIGTADILTSVPFCMAGIEESDDVFVSFFFQQQGLADFPNTGDSLFLELKDIRIDNDGNERPGVWNTVWSQAGQNMDLPEGPFDFVIQQIADGFIEQPYIIDSLISIVPDTLSDDPLIIDMVETLESVDTVGMATYFLPGFQFRFRSRATATGNNDHWHIDYVTLNQNVTPGTASELQDVSHVGPARSFLNNYTLMPWNQFVNNQDTELNDSIIIPISNVATTNTQLERATVIITELCSENEIDSLVTGILDLPPGITVVTTDDIGGDILIRSQIPDVPNRDNGIVIRTETILEASENEIFTNDTLVQDQIFSNIYAYDDGSAEKVFQISVSGTQFAYRFVVNEPDVVTGMSFAFNQISQNVDPGSGTLRLLVFEDILRSVSVDGTLEQQGEQIMLYEENDIPFPFPGDQQNSFHNYDFAEAVAVTDTFYIGFELENPGSITVGYDRNNNNIDKWYTRDGGFWESLVTSPTFPTGTPMIRALMGSGIPVGIDDDQVEETFELFPNPTRDQIRVTVPGSQEDLSYSIYDTTGKQLSSSNLGNGLINVESLASGVYFIEILDGAASTYKRQKFVKL